MWVKSDRVLHLRNPYTDFNADFDSRMVKEGIPLEVPDDDFFAEHIKTRENGKPLTVVPETKAKKLSDDFWATVEKEAEAIKVQKTDLMNSGTVVGFQEGKDMVVPKVERPSTPPEPVEEEETKKGNK